MLDRLASRKLSGERARIRWTPLCYNQDMTEGDCLNYQHTLLDHPNSPTSPAERLIAGLDLNSSWTLIWDHD